MSKVIAIAVGEAIGIIAGVGLSFVSAALEVPPDEKLTAARNALPGANCGGCGFFPVVMHMPRLLYTAGQKPTFALPAVQTLQRLWQRLWVSAPVNMLKKPLAFFVTAAKTVRHKNMNTAALKHVRQRARFSAVQGRAASAVSVSEIV